MYRFGMSDTFSAIIDLWPSPAELAADLGTTAVHIRTMRQRNFVNAKYWKRMVAGAERRGIGAVSTDRMAAIAEAMGFTDHRRSLSESAEGEAA